jgi:hypothetical protein
MAASSASATFFGFTTAPAMATIHVAGYPATGKRRAPPVFNHGRHDRERLLPDFGLTRTASAL